LSRLQNGPISKSRQTGLKKKALKSLAKVRCIIIHTSTDGPTGAKVYDRIYEDDRSLDS
jgi:hypothetical protein